jgi:anion-transporting  ArsA/GET3 family ATPase
VIVTGAGGVGKTTVSAALAVAAARSGRRTLVLTIDPARRLADALGIAELGNRPTPVEAQPGLWAAMLDAAASWEAIVYRHADPLVAERLLENPFFRAIADRFPAAQSYAAGEEMAEYLEARAWETLIIDTPPAGGGIDFFSAPGRMRELVGGKVLRFLTGASLPGRRALYRITTRPMLRIADSVLGGPLLEDVAEFLLDLRTLYDGLARRADAIERYLRSATTLVVTTAEPSAVREARRFFETLPGIAAPPAAVVFNRVLPDTWISDEAPYPDGEIDPATSSELHENLRNWGAEARRQSDARREFAARYATATASVPWQDEAPTSLEALAAMFAAATGLEVAGITSQPS